MMFDKCNEEKKTINHENLLVTLVSLCLFLGVERPTSAHLCEKKQKS